MLTNFHEDEAKKYIFFFFEKKKIKMADSKKGHFSKPPILNIFLYGCHIVVEWRQVRKWWVGLFLLNRAGIRIVDVGQPNILIPLQIPVLKTLQPTSN